MKIALALNSAIQHGIAYDDRLAWVNLNGTLWWVYDQLATRQTLTHIVVTLAFDLKRDTTANPCSKGLSGRAGQLYMNGIVR